MDAKTTLCALQLDYYEIAWANEIRHTVQITFICSDRTMEIVYTSDIVIGTGIVYCGRNRS